MKSGRLSGHPLARTTDSRQAHRWPIGISPRPSAWQRAHGCSVTTRCGDGSARIVSAAGHQGPMSVPRYVLPVLPQPPMPRHTCPPGGYPHMVDVLPVIVRSYLEYQVSVEHTQNRYLTLRCPENIARFWCEVAHKSKPSRVPSLALPTSSARPAHRS